MYYGLSLQSLEDFYMLLLVLFVAVFAKLVGCSIGAKLMGLNFRESITVGILMNTRG